MTALLRYPALLKHNNGIGIDNGGQPVGNNQAGVIGGYFADRIENALLGTAVEG